MFLKDPGFLSAAIIELKLVSKQDESIFQAWKPGF